MGKKSFISNLLWRFFERCGAQGVTLVVSIILARLLEPEVYGTLALVTVFTTLMQVFVDSGLGTALVQKKDADDLDFSSVFYANFVICLILYLVMFAAAPYIAAFYERPELVPVIRVLSLTLVISGLKNIQQAYVSRHMLFKKFFFATLGGTIGAAVLGILMAYWGFGVWALVAQHLFNAAVDTCILWFTVKWRPKREFSWERLKKLLGFGWKLLASKLLDTGYGELRSLLIGKYYTSSDLAFYNRGQQFPNLLTNNINDSIDSVLFPKLAQKQDSIDEVKMLSRRAMKTSTYIMAPLMMGLFACAEPFVRIVLTEKWLPCVFFLRVCCITYMFYPVHTANLNAIKAVGRSDLFLLLEVIKKISGLMLLLITLPMGVKAMALSLLVQSLINQLINSWPNRKLLNYKYWEQIKDILPNLLLAAFMGGFVYVESYLALNDWALLFLQVITGMIIYISGSALFRLDSFVFLKEMLMSVLMKKRSS